MCFRVEELNQTIASLSEETQREIYSRIVQSLRGKETSFLLLSLKSGSKT